MTLLSLALAFCPAQAQEEKVNPFQRCRIDAKPELLKRGGGGSNTEDAVLRALRWLARHQSEDGAWRVTGHTARCAKGATCTPNPGAEEGDGLFRD